MEWLFLTSHNHWIICRLVSNAHNPFLAYSPCISMEDSSEPFRALLGAMLSVYHNIPVLATVFSDNNVLEEDPREDQGDGMVMEDNTDAGSYVDDSNTSTITLKVPMSHSRMGVGQATGSELMVHPITSHFLSVGSLVHFSDYFFLSALP